MNNGIGRKKLVEAAGDVVTVLAEVAARPEEIDVQAPEAERFAAEAALKVATGPEFGDQRARVEAVVTRISVATRR